MRDLTHGSVEVGLKPALICTAGQDVSGVLVQNVGDTPVFVGSGQVTSDGPNRGIRINPGESQSFSVYPHDSTSLYAVTVKQNNHDKDVSATVVFMVS